MIKELCEMCLRRKVDCGIRKFRRFPWRECKHFLEDKETDNKKVEDR